MQRTRRVCWSARFLTVIAAAAAVLAFQQAARAEAKVARIIVMDESGKPVPNAHVQLDDNSAALKRAPLSQVGKGEWLMHQVGSKVRLAVRDGATTRSVEVALPQDAGPVVNVVLHLENGSIRAEVAAPQVNPIKTGPLGNARFNALAAGEAPANDLCPGAIDLGSLPASVTADNLNATSNIVTPCGLFSGPFNEVWYSIVGDGSTLTASTCNDGTVIDDTKLSIFCADCDSPVCVTGNDDDASCAANDFLSTVSWCSEVGRTYLIAIGGFSGSTAEGAFELTVNNGAACNDPPVCAPPANDNCGGAIPVGPLPASVAGNNGGATSDIADGDECGVFSGPWNNVWYSFVGNGSTVTVSTCDAGTTHEDTKISIFCSDCDFPVCVTGNDDDATCASNDFLSTASFCSEPGRTYFVTVGGFADDTPPGDFVLNITGGAACANPPDCGAPTGACCQGTTCNATTTEADCALAGGTWHEGEACPGFVCPSCVGGDTCDDAQTIPGVPYSDVGNTCDCSDNYDEICPFDAPGSPEVVYSYTPAQDECVNITLCNGSAYDTKLYVYENVCGAYQSGTFFACNDDACPGFVSELENLFLTGGNTYYIVVDGYDGECGDYQIDISPCGPPCDVTCDPGSTPEGEPVCGDNYNDTFNTGCNSVDNPTFSPAVCNASVCGEGGTFLAEIPCTSDFDCPFPEICDLGFGICTGGPYEFRDTDWYRFTVGAPTQVTYTVEAEFPVLFGIVNNFGVDSCAGVTSFLVANSVDDCTEGTVTACLGAGTWYLLVAPADFTGVACGLEYEASLACEPCPTGACCLSTGACTPDVAEPDCAGTWQGPGTNCNPNLCPQPQPNDLCEDAVPVAVPSTTAGSTVLAGVDTGFPSPCGDATITSPGVWYTVTGTGNTITASLCNMATAFDTKLSVFCDDCVEPACVDGNDDFCGLQSEVTWCSESGRTYYILVHGFGGASGPFELNVSEDGIACGPAPSCEPPQLCPGIGECCEANGDIGCNDVTCCELICGIDPFCCGQDPVFGGFWDELCAEEAIELCEACEPAPPTGGCCVGLGCTILTAADCALQGGTYLGDNASCSGGGVGNPEVFVGNVNEDIPDNGGPGNAVTHAINVPDSLNVGDLNIDLDITHTWVGDLIVTVEHNATSVTIVDRIGFTGTGFGCNSNDLLVIVDDEGSGGPIEDNCGPSDTDPTPTSPPNYQPNNPLAAFIGMNAQGLWTITVSDNADFDTGTMNSWSLHVDQPGPNPCIPRGACCTGPNECTVLTVDDCATAGGVYLGDGTSCEALGATTVYQASPGIDIPDNGGDLNPASHTINVPDGYTLADVDVDFQTDHTWVGDLIITVEHNATSAIIVDRMGYTGSGFGCNSDGLDIILDDEGAGGAIEDNCGPSDASSTPSSPPNYSPNDPLSVFDGMSAAGAWTITVSDNADFDTGALLGWSLHLTATGPSPCAGQFGACCDGNTGLCTDDVLPSACVGDQREYFAGQTCAELDPACEQHRGACCDTLAGICTDNVLPGQCSGVTQIWSKGTPCSGVTCLPPTGACCVRSSGTCTENVSEAQCSSLGGEWSLGIACVDVTPPCEASGVIPTVSEWGLVILTLLMLAFSKVYFGRREEAAA